jgi:glutathione S-transferase
MNGTKVRLGYWGIRGRGQVPRLLLAYTQAVWEDVQYTSPEQWFGGDKQSLGLNFPNLPYLIEGDLKITETEAICHYIIDRSNKKELLGKSPQHKAVVMNIIGVLNECFDNVVKILYVPDGLKTK